MTPATHELLVAAAVQRCLDAYHRTLAIPRKPDGTGSVHDYACEAYRNAMPFLSSPANIDAFIACVAHGMLIEAISFNHASKLLYAAQVATTSRRAQQQKQPTRPDAQHDSQLDTQPTPTLNGRAEV